MRFLKYLGYFINFLFSIFIFVLFFAGLVVSIFTLFDTSFLTKLVYPLFKSYKINLLFLELYANYLIRVGYWSFLINSLLFILSLLYLFKAFNRCFGNVNNFDLGWVEKISNIEKLSNREINKAIKVARENKDFMALGLLYLAKDKFLKAFYYLKDFRPGDFENEKDYLKIYDLYVGHILHIVEDWNKKSFFEKILWKIFHPFDPNPGKFSSFELKRKIYKDLFDFYLRNKKFLKAFEIFKDFPITQNNNKERDFKLSLGKKLERVVEEYLEKTNFRPESTGSFFTDGFKLTAADLYKLLEELYENLDEKEKKAKILLIQKKKKEAADIFLEMGKYRESAEIYYSIENYKRALEVIDSIGDEDKGSEELLLKIKSLVKLGFSKRAIKLLKRFEEKLYGDENFKVLMGTGKVCYDLRLGDEAIKFLKKAEEIDAVKFSKNNGPFLLGELLSEKSAFEKMEKNLNVYSETNPKLMVKEILNETKDGRDVEINFFDSTYVISERYELVEELGRGGAGIVYLARDKILDRHVAVKELKKISSVKDEDKIKEFFKEARLLAKLNHQNIVQLYDILKDDLGNGERRYFIIMEYIDGSSLEDMIKEMSPMKLKFAIPIILQVLDGLYFAHRKDIIHMDIKPANILITYGENTPKITDFGIAKAMFSLFNPDDKFRGTPKYVSPEVILGKTIDVRADIYSLGVTFFEMLTGEIPYSKNVKSVKEFVENKINSKPYELSKFLLNVDETLENIVMKAISHDPEERYSSALEMKKELEEFYDKIKNIKEEEE